MLQLISKVFTQAEKADDIETLTISIISVFPGWNNTLMFMSFIRTAIGRTPWTRTPSPPRQRRNNVCIVLDFMPFVAPFARRLHTYWRFAAALALLHRNTFSRGRSYSLPSPRFMSVWLPGNKGFSSKLDLWSLLEYNGSRSPVNTNASSFNRN